MKKEERKHYGYIVWGMATMIYIIVFFHRVALGVMKEDVIAGFHLGATGDVGSQFALIASMYMYAYMLMQIPTGILADTLGARKTIALGSIVASLGTVLFALGDAMWMGLIGRFIVGLGVAVVFVCVLKIIAEWFPENRFSTLSGITSFIGNMGAILAMTPLIFVNEQLGWRTTLLGIAGIHITLGIICFVTMKEKTLQQTSTLKMRFKDTFQGVKLILKDKALYQVMIGYGIIFGATMGLTGTWGVSIIQDIYHTTQQTAANMMSVMTLGVAVGSICIGRLADKWQSHRKTMGIFAGAHFGCWMLFAWIQVPQEFIPILMFAMGFTGTSFIVSWSYAKQRHAKTYAATAMSVVNFAGFLGGAVVPQLMGMLYDQMVKIGQTQVWDIPLKIIALLIGGAAICFATTRQGSSIPSEEKVQSVAN